MKNVILLSLLSMLGIYQLQAQTSDERAIKKVIVEFMIAGDQNDTPKLDNCLDDNYRVVMNQLFGSTEVMVIPKSVYLQKIKSKEWGGDKRTADIQKITINGNTAMAKVVFKGEKMTFNSLMTLVKDVDGKWKLVSDVPVVV